MKTVSHWINGKPFGDASGASGTWGPVTDPATGEVTAQVAMAGADEVDAAVAAAKQAYATRASRSRSSPPSSEAPRSTR
jgi:malonate-semialdehyde dehydrogenase (acetylating)/methylmalonate-semialdehyde dehydrogenase